MNDCYLYTHDKKEFVPSLHSIKSERGIRLTLSSTTIETSLFYTCLRYSLG